MPKVGNKNFAYTKIGKAAAVTSATISGIEGVQNAYTTAQKSPLTALFKLAQL